MTRLLLLVVVATVTSVKSSPAQSAPKTPDKPWSSQSSDSVLSMILKPAEKRDSIQTSRALTLAELIDIAQGNNPSTREAWEVAKRRAADLGVARSSWYPTISAIVTAQTLRQGGLVTEHWARQTEGLFIPVLHLDYEIFDFGKRSGIVDESKANLLAANLRFNDLHRRLIYDVTEAYYVLLDREGQRQATETSLHNAQIVEDEARDRLLRGVGTRPDLLEATAAREQAEYDLEAAKGQETVAKGHLATVLSIPVQTDLKVQPIEELRRPVDIAGPVDEQLQRALLIRPDLLAIAAKLKAADAEIRQARSVYAPTLSFSGDGGLARAYGQLNLAPGHYAQSEYWNASLELRWTLFDGARREYAVAEAAASRRAALDELNTAKDRVEEEVWSAYVRMQTAIRKQQVSEALVASSQASYDASRESYTYGVRNIIDVVQAQKALALAKSQEVTARAQALLEISELAFRVGDTIAVVRQPNSSYGKGGPGDQR